MVPVQSKADLEASILRVTMFSQREVYWPQLVNVMLANLLLFSTSILLSLGVFTVPIETAAPSLKSVWASGLGLGNLLSAPAISLTGFLLDTRTLPLHSKEEHPVTRRIHRLALPVSALYFALMLAVPAINSSSAFLLRFSTVPLAVPSGVAYILTIESLLAWMPCSPGLAMTFVSAGFGLSQFILSPVLTVSISLLGVRAVLFATALSSFLACYVSLRYLVFPTQTDMTAIGPPTAAPEAHIELLASSSGSDNVLTWGKLLRMPEFYFYILVTFTGRSGQSLIPYYFKLGDVFGLSISSVVVAFQALSILGILYAFAGTSLLEYLSSPHRSAVRPLLAGVFFFQVIFFSLLVPLSRAENGPIALMLISCLIVMLETQTAFGVILARDTFGNKNSALVFGVAGGISFGAGAAFFTSLMAGIEHSSGDGISTPASFIKFYPLAACSSLIGALCVLSMRKKTSVFG